MKQYLLILAVIFLMYTRDNFDKVEQEEKKQEASSPWRIFAFAKQYGRCMCIYFCSNDPTKAVQSSNRTHIGVSQHEAISPDIGRNLFAFKKGSFDINKL
ncbi:unnamed protein product [Larinioides sclopetarius]|uniref:Uncharacterized protein n=1 Tax=Larinioides sclopetarius TaxID=280406 RepID=A0AAV2BPD9_9ARAC